MKLKMFDMLHKYKNEKTKNTNKPEKEQEIKPVEKIIKLLEERVDNPCFTVHLNKNELDYLAQLVKTNPVIFHDIHEEVTKILQDGVLNIHDIPEIVALVTNIFHIHFVENYIDDFGVINIVQFILDIMLDTGVFHIADIEIEILKKVIKTSLVLLKMDVTIKKEIACCQGFMGFFTKK